MSSCNVLRFVMCALAILSHSYCHQLMIFENRIIWYTIKCALIIKISSKVSSFVARLSINIKQRFRIAYFFVESKCFLDYKFISPLPVKTEETVHSLYRCRKVILFQMLFQTFVGHCLVI